MFGAPIKKSFPARESRPGKRCDGEASKTPVLWPLPPAPFCSLFASHRDGTMTSLPINTPQAELSLPRSYPWWSWINRRDRRRVVHPQAPKRLLSKEEEAALPSAAHVRALLAHHLKATLDSQGFFVYSLCPPAGPLLRFSLADAPRTSLSAAFGQFVWTGSVVLARQLCAAAAAAGPSSPSQQCFIDVRGKSVIEVGAGAGIVSVVAALQGAAAVVATELPDPFLIANLQDNIERNVPRYAARDHVRAVPFAWGEDTSTLQLVLSSLLTSPEASSASSPSSRSPETHNRWPKFDLVFMSDLLWISHAHALLLKSCKELVVPGTGRVIVCFGGYISAAVCERFLAMARSDSFGFHVRCMGSVRMDLEAQCVLPVVPVDHNEVLASAAVDPQRTGAEQEQTRQQTVFTYEMWLD